MYRHQQKWISVMFVTRTNEIVHLFLVAMRTSAWNVQTTYRSAIIVGNLLAKNYTLTPLSINER